MTKRISSIVLLSLLLLIPACQNSPTAPSTPEVKVISIVTSPSGTVFFVGATIQLTATATMSDGRKQRIASGVWSSSDPDVATVDPSGLVTIVGVGMAVITAAYGGKTGSLSIRGMEEGLNPADLLGTWQASKAEGWRTVGHVEVVGSRRDLVAEGGTVTLVLEANRAYTITVAMPGAKPGIDTGSWHYGNGSGRPQIDFYPSSIPNPDYGDVPAFLVALSGNTLTLWDSGLSFLPFDFGWDPYDTVLNLVFTRR